MAFLTNDQFQHTIAGDRGNRIFARSQWNQRIDQGLGVQTDQMLAALGQLTTGQGLEQAFLQTVDLYGRFAIKPQPAQELFKDLRTVAR
ncbi:hypothetical protein D3C84_1086840 [compost metagenome]